MKALLQRVSRCAVRAGGREVSRIGRGLLVLVGVSHSDDDKDVDFITSKAINLRIFDDAEGKLNLSLAETGGEIMLVSQFTLCGDTRKGRRPGYTEAASPQQAELLYEKLYDAFTQAGFAPARGVFGAHMEVELINDGPVTLLLESPPHD